ncbi:MAG: type VI secretion system baseplate subunit TssG [Phycisphaerae bacterium]|nr:type VI secretion system baseplate subunit TssG [Phycisphaerae bacterium]
MTATDTVNPLAPRASRGRLSLLERLRKRAWEFDFFQAVWLFERYRGIEVPVGQRGPVARERLRFRPDLSLGFPATDVRRITECRDPAGGEPYYLLDVTFLGMYGVSTPLPVHYAIDILRASDPTVTDESTEDGREQPADAPPASSPVRDFLDIFHHRVISLFYRSWLKYRYERMFAAPRRDAITEYLRLLIGCPPSFDESTLGLPPIRLIRYAGALTQHPRSATTLAGVLYDYWENIPVRVSQFLGQWVPLEEADLNRFGLANSGLGVDLTVGDQVYDLGGAFNIAVGPVDWDTYLSFVPGGFRYMQTRALTKLYCCDPLAFTLEVTLRAGEVPETQLTSDSTAGALGMTSWARTEEMGETSVTFAASEESSVTLGMMPDQPQARAA